MRQPDINRLAMEQKSLNITIASQDIPDLYKMIRWHIRYCNNTFIYLKRELDEKYPSLKEKYGGNDDDTEYYTAKQRSHRQSAIITGYKVKKGYDERMNLYKPKWLIKKQRRGCAFERNLTKLGFNIIEMETDYL